MANGWQLVRFGNILNPVSSRVPVEPVLVPDATDRILEMRWYAQGLFLKEEKLGQEIRAKEGYRVELGDFVYNRLFAWKDSFGIVERDTHHRARGCAGAARGRSAWSASGNAKRVGRADAQHAKRG